MLISSQPARGTFPVWVIYAGVAESCVRILELSVESTSNDMGQDIYIHDGKNYNALHVLRIPRHPTLHHSKKVVVV
jgi:hypothetical protein